jgi:hypothetical protein
VMDPFLSVSVIISQMILRIRDHITSEDYGCYYISCFLLIAVVSFTKDINKALLQGMTRHWLSIPGNRVRLLKT